MTTNGFTADDAEQLEKLIDKARIARGTLTHRYRAEKRAALASDVAGGMSVADAAKKHDLAENTAYQACQEFGVRVKKLKVKSRSLEIIGRAFTCNSLTEISKEFGVSVQLVSAIVSQARDCGIPVPETPRGRKKQS